MFPGDGGGGDTIGFTLKITSQPEPVEYGRIG